MRKITGLIIHCSATPEGREVTQKDLYRWHVVERGWSDIGYHTFIQLDGTVVQCRPIEKVGAHCKGHNSGTIGICYAGGVDAKGQPKDTRTSAQKTALIKVIIGYLEQFPTITAIDGHNRFAAKACPSFDATTEYAPLLSREPVSPVFDNPKDDDDPDQPLSWLEETIQLLEEANLLQKKARDQLDEVSKTLEDAANTHWRALEKARSGTGEIK